MRSLRLKPDGNDLPVRPDFGKAGTQIKLRTNFFPINVPKGPIYEYNVDIDPPANNKRLKKRIFYLAEQSNEWRQAGMTNKVAHDNSAKIYSAIELATLLVIRIMYTEEDDEDRQQPREPTEYTMTITFIQPIETQGLLRYVFHSNPSSSFLLERGNVMRVQCTVKCNEFDLHAACLSELVVSKPAPSSLDFSVQVARVPLLTSAI